MFPRRCEFELEIFFTGMPGNFPFHFFPLLAAPVEPHDSPFGEERL
jgi:hypothetical protein